MGDKNNLTKISSEVFLLILYNMKKIEIKDLINIYYSFYNHRNLIIYELNKYLDYYTSRDMNLDHLIGFFEVDNSPIGFDFSESDNEKITISVELFKIEREIYDIFYRNFEENDDQYINKKKKMIKNLRINNSDIINTIVNSFLKCHICKNNNINKIENVYRCYNCDKYVCIECCDILFSSNSCSYCYNCKKEKENKIEKESFIIEHHQLSFDFDYSTNDEISDSE